MTDNDILEAILQREGAYSDDSGDRGRSTAWGISSRFHPEAWRNGPPTREQAKAIYAAEYLKPFAEVEPIELRAQVVDIAVNSGQNVARTLLSRAVQQPNGKPVAIELVIARLRYYARIVQGDVTQARFLGGWIARSCEFL